MKKVLIIFFIAFNSLCELFAQDTVVSISFKSFYSPYNGYQYSGPFDIFSNFSKDNFAFSSEIGLSYSKIDLHGGIEYLRRGINFYEYEIFHDPESGPFGSHSSTEDIRMMNYKGKANNLILKFGSDVKIMMFRKFLCLSPGIDMGYSFRVSSKELVNETRIEHNWSYFNGQDSTYGGSSSVTSGKATDYMEFNKHLFFSDFKLSIGNNNGKFQYSLTAGFRKYFTYFLKYKEIVYYYERIFSKDKYWEISIRYRL